MSDEYDPLTDDLIERLRTPKVTHHQISDAGESYATTARVHPVERIKLEAAAALQAQATEIAALRAFHSFFLNKGESLFASFGMDAIDLLNKAATEQECTTNTTR